MQDSRIPSYLASSIQCHDLVFSCEGRERSEKAVQQKTKGCGQRKKKRMRAAHVCNDRILTAQGFHGGIHGSERQKSDLGCAAVNCCYFRVGESRTWHSVHTSFAPIPVRPFHESPVDHSRTSADPNADPNFFCSSIFGWLLQFFYNFTAACSNTR